MPPLRKKRFMGELWVKDVTACPRCGGPHTLSWQRLRRPSPEYVIVADPTQLRRSFVWWAMCPVTNEPIVTDQTLNPVHAIA